MKLWLSMVALVGLAAFAYEQVPKKGTIGLLEGSSSLLVDAGGTGTRDG